jgi:hypothetical protein
MRPAQAAVTDLVHNDNERHVGALPDAEELEGSGEHVPDTDRKRGDSDPVTKGPHHDGPHEPGRKLFGI